MPYKIQNKMYILSGGVSGEDILDDYRFMTKQGLSKIPWTYTHRLFDTALEVDMTGKNIEFDKFESDSYWTTSDTTKLKDLKVTVVAYIDGKWKTLDIDPYEDDAHEYLEKQGYSQKIGYGGGWFSKDKKASYKDVVFSFFKDRDRNIGLEYDIKEDKYAGMVADMKRDEITIWNSDTDHWWKNRIGSLKVEDDTTVIHLYDEVYRFKTEQDEDFTKWSLKCLEAYTYRFVKHCKEEDKKKGECKDDKHYEDLKTWVESHNDFEVNMAKEYFARRLKDCL